MQNPDYGAGQVNAYRIALMDIIEKLFNFRPNIRCYVVMPRAWKEQKLQSIQVWDPNASQYVNKSVDELGEIFPPAQVDKIIEEITPEVIEIRGFKIGVKYV
ncbi:MAG: hypothetical protein AOA65_1527 [Candidatus Bathyarchaeota archaeon BA1]|nr:MAG: hypothetical protein AOA65_1527 [Candidatus Bathyarchaeota archaeon BA1]